MADQERISRPNSYEINSNIAYRLLIEGVDFTIEEIRKRIIAEGGNENMRMPGLSMFEYFDNIAKEVGLRRNQINGKFEFKSNHLEEKWTYQGILHDPAHL